MSAVVIFASAPAALCSEPLRALLAEHARANPVVYVRDRDRVDLGTLLTGVDVRSDKPEGGRLRFVRQLRSERTDLAIAFWFGHDEYWQAKALFALTRAARKVAVTERGGPPIPAGGFVAPLRHLLWRRKHRVASPYGRGGLARAALRTLYRATLGRALGALVTVLRYVLGR